MLSPSNFGSVLGKGKSGSIVVKGQNKLSMKEVAVKVIPKLNLSQVQIDQKRGIIEIYKLAQHHNLVRLEDYFENRDNIYLCLELHSTDTLL